MQQGGETRTLFDIVAAILEDRENRLEGIGLLSAWTHRCEVMGSDMFTDAD
ncbi:MAG TPA: hypothetical protein VF026_24380 [Ktedonobacteraceae bacterium]